MKNLDVSAVTDTTGFLQKRAKNLDEAIDRIQLEAGSEEAIASKEAGKSLRDGVLDIVPFGKIISAILNWNESVDSEIREAKKEHLLALAIERSKNADVAINNIRKIVTSAQGNILFNKILRILDDNPADESLSGHLASALIYIYNTDYEKLFNDHRFALGQIERVTPHALTLLAQSHQWPLFQLRSMSINGNVVESKWANEFSIAFSEKIGYPSISERLAHVCEELIRGGLVRAIADPKSTERLVQPIPTSIGKIVIPYLTAGTHP